MNVNAEDQPRSDTALASLYGAAGSLLGREGRWRGVLAGHIAPNAHDLVVDFQCGAGDLAFQLARLQPMVRVIGVDRDAALIARAQTRAADTRASLAFAHATPDDVAVMLGAATATKVIVTLTDTHRTSEKLRRLHLARAILDPLGSVFVIDYGVQRTALMRGLHNAARALRDAPPADPHDTLTPLMRAAEFVAVDETVVWPTPSGSVSLHRARAS